MDRTRFIEHRGRQILLLDFTEIWDLQVALQEIEKARELIAQQKPDGSLLTLTDARGAHFTSEVVEALKSLTAHNKPYVKAAAAITGSGLHKVALMAVTRFSGRQVEAFTDPELAKDWLVDQV